MGESSAVLRYVATETGCTLVPSGEQLFPRKFGLVCRALWPRKTAAHLAAKAGVTERAAKYWLSGERPPSAAAVGAVIAEMLG